MAVLRYYDFKALPHFGLSLKHGKQDYQCIMISVGLDAQFIILNLICMCLHPAVYVSTM
jgi:hypothetical protein